MITFETMEDYLSQIIQLGQFLGALEGNQGIPLSVLNQIPILGENDVQGKTKPKDNIKPGNIKSNISSLGNIKPQDAISVTKINDPPVQKIKRLVFTDFPLLATIQLGKSIGNEIIWEQEQTTILNWKVGSNLFDQEGIAADLPGETECYSSYCPKDNIYGRYDHFSNGLENMDEDDEYANEHYLRVLEVFAPGN